MRLATVVLAGAILPACAGWIEEDDLWLDDPSTALGSATVYGHEAPSVTEPRPPSSDEPPSSDDVPTQSEALGGRIGVVTSCRLSTHVEVRPRLEASDIRRTIRRHENDIRVCYNGALRRNPTAAGRVSIAFLIRSDGTVPAAPVESSEIEDPQLHACISRTIRSLTFPVPPDATPSLVHYPFVFAVRRAE